MQPTKKAIRYHRNEWLAVPSYLTLKVHLIQGYGQKYIALYPFPISGEPVAAYLRLNAFQP